MHKRNVQTVKIEIYYNIVSKTGAQWVLKTSKSRIII